MDWEVSSRLQDVEVLFREWVVVEWIQRSIFCCMRIQCCRMVTLKPRETSPFGGVLSIPRSVAIIVRIFFRLVHMREVGIVLGIEVSRSWSLGSRHLLLFWSMVSHDCRWGRMLLSITLVVCARTRLVC